MSALSNLTIILQREDLTPTQKVFLINLIVVDTGNEYRVDQWKCTVPYIRKKSKEVVEKECRIPRRTVFEIKKCLIQKGFLLDLDSYRRKKGADVYVVLPKDYWGKKGDFKELVALRESVDNSIELTENGYGNFYIMYKNDYYRSRIMQHLLLEFGSINVCNDYRVRDTGKRIKNLVESGSSEELRRPDRFISDRLYISNADYFISELQNPDYKEHYLNILKCRAKHKLTNIILSQYDDIFEQEGCKDLMLRPIRYNELKNVLVAVFEYDGRLMLH